jgi:hypothetical protein
LVRLIPGACFETPQDGLLPGDTIVYNDGGPGNGNGHVVLIDRISAGGGTCEFSIIHSSSAEGRIGPQISLKGGSTGGGRVSDAFGAFSNRLGKNCAALVKDMPGVKIGRFNSKPGCQGEKKPIKNEECIREQCGKELGISFDI